MLRVAKVLFRRMMLVLASIGVFSISFPLIAGLPMNALIIFIPMSYVWYVIPAAALGATIGLLLAFGTKWFKPGKASTIVFGTLLGPIYSFIYLDRVMTDRLLSKPFSTPFNSSHSTALDHQLVILFFAVACLVILIANIVASIVCSMFFRGKMIDDLLKK